MKKLIITTLVAGFISLSFTVVKNPVTKNKVIAKIQNSEKMDFSNKLNEKRLASWD